MALNFPTLTEIINKAKTGIKNALPNSNPWLKNSFLDAISRMAAGRVYDFYYNLEKNVLPELFLDTAQDSDSIEALNTPFSLEKVAGTLSTGNLIGSGTLTTVIPVGTSFQDSTGYIYNSTSEAIISSSSISVTALSQVGGITTAISANHGFYSGLSVVISGANESDYNGTFDILVINEDTFSYTVDTGAATPATGTILATATIVSIPIESVEVGSDKNLDGGQSLTVTIPISGFDDDVYVEYPALIGGTDLESNESFKSRGLARYSNPSASFSVGDIESDVRTDINNTRIWVQPITPDVGQTTVYFVRDNDGTGSDILPDSTAISEAIDNIRKPANFDYANDLFVLAPTPVTIDFTFTSITPSTPEMQTAIQNSLTVFFQDVVNLAVNITEIEYNSAIINTIDATGSKLTAFTLSSPSGDISISTGELGLLGSVTF